MPQFRFSEAAGLLGVSDDTVRRWVRAGQLTSQVDAAGRKVVDGAELAAFAREQATGPEDPSAVGRSARNRFVGLVTEVVVDKVMAQVELQCGPQRVVSLMSTEAVRELGLRPGVLAVAVVKATTVVVETPGGER
ncbi:TOBE domain-containing protein [Amycolatopsis acidiphila]|uniref:Helix-turn-helix domain-containing protein n=1 Tax=Amycolatopsis acidiphila TaxID=715473 RepID=A0A558AJM9_9PSEU|nr:TOBE domain-containing protein [Amycolatopsis acidiphila]TVT24475.1 helix-turn-helix domain-containing protein [Amycolatopsis acidiphila]UIJ59314.1 TOBE domain-containing protein [Amycolatopsis acidiphila]GHG79656.1 MerR family transcriptional regulator [Amycolatopsis acidiphila]